MANLILDSREYLNLKKSGIILNNILNHIKKNVKIGSNFLEIENIVDKLIDKNRALGSFKNYNGFPSSVCISKNNNIVHGIPYDYTIQAGDLVSIDIGINYKNMFSDSAITLNFSESKKDKILCDTTKKALENAIKIIKPGVKTGDIGFIISQTAKSAGLKVIKDLTGHGTGHKVHEKPTIHNIGTQNTGVTIKKGDVLAVEPMFAFESEEIITSNDGWSILTKKGDKSAHFEHTVFVKENCAEIIT